MRILNFTEPLVKPSLQDRSKCTTFRKAWDWLDEGHNKNACWREQEECRHKVGALEQLMWIQRGKNGACFNCIHSDMDGNPDNCKYVGVTPCSFSKVFGVGKILQTPKVWMKFYPDWDIICILPDIPRTQVNIATRCLSEKIIFEQDGFKNYRDGIGFFRRHYQIIEREWMPFWGIGWDWQK